MEITSEEKIIWDRYQCDQEDGGLVLTYVFEIVGYLNIKKLEKALSKTVEHFSENLLNSFVNSRFGIQKKKIPFPEKYLHIFEKTFSLTTNFCKKQINIEAGQLFFFALKLPEKTNEGYKLFLSFSHICFDGLSYVPFITKLSDIYNGKETDINVPSGNNTFSHSSDEAKYQNYWKQKIETLKLSQQLPFQLDSKKSSSQESLVIKSVIQNQQFDDFNKFCKMCDTTCFQVMTMLLGLVLYKYCDENIALSYTCTTNRRKNRVGCYFNLIPMNFLINDDFSIKECIEYIKKERQEVYRFTSFPFKKILDFIPQVRDNNLFNVVVNESEGLLPLCSLDFSKCSIKLLETPNLSGPYDLSLIYNKSSDKIIYAISVPINKMTAEALEDFSLSFNHVLNFILTNSIETKIKSCNLSKDLFPILSGKEFHISQNDTIIQHFQKNCKTHPQKIAISYDNKNITYKELNILRKKILINICNDKSQAPIAFFLSRTEFIPAAMLAMLSIGRPYVPIDTKLPIERIKYILSSSNADTIFVDENTFNIIENIGINTKKINLSCIHNHIYDHDFTFNVNHKTNAYILFTSGSTGNPKGVVVTQGNLVNFLYSMIDLLGIDSDSKILAITSVSFDISVLELILPLFIGASIELANDEENINLLKLSQLIDVSNVNILQATPAIFRGLRSIKWNPKNKLKIICGGEAVDKELSKYLIDIGDEIYNVYGPTETTVWSSFSKINRENDISIGVPIYNTKYFVVDEHMKSVPIGKQGQLLISGKCVSNGYINASSRDSFIRRKGVEEKLYCTGDIVKYLGDEKLIYIGRQDNQIKINGYRIDLSEIKNALSKNYKNIDFFIVLRNISFQQKNIVCFYANDIKHEFDSAFCKEKLKLSLPTYMIPTDFFHLKKIPLNTSGKVDIKFLSEADMHNIDLLITEKTIQKSDNKSEIICATLQDTLNIDTSNLNVSLGSLGFDSITYTKLSVILNERFKIKIKPHEFYKFSTLNELILYIAGSNDILKSETHKLIKEKIKVYILGMSTLLPYNLNNESFWNSLVEKKDLISYPEKERNLSQTLKGGYLLNIDEFDNTFFSISALEASNMDPRQKQLLQITWQAIEDSGFSKNDLIKKKVGCYIATTGGDYYKDGEQNVYSMTGRAMSIISNRISRYFDWRGPSITIDTACSGSLVALVQAYNDLVHGICDFAFVGSANIIFDEKNSEALKIANFLSPHFRCATFDQSADGYVRSEGICGIFLASSEAIPIEKYDNIIRASVESVALGHGGKSNSLTAPNMTALTELYLEAYDKELLQEVSYIETHGTGTKLGDPIEITSLNNAWKYLLKDNFNHNVYLGAVKTNVGHTEASAGLTSIIKVLLSIEHKLLVSNLHFNRLNDEINLENTPFRILDQHVPWNFCSNRIAGVSSFGFGGMNLHVVLKEFPNIKRSDPDDFKESYIIPISARSKQALLEYILKFKSFLQNKKTKLRLCDISYTLAIGRMHFEYRCAFIVESIDDLINQLDKAQVCFVSTGTLAKYSQNPVQVQDLNLNSIVEKFLKGAFIAWSNIFDKKEVRKVHLPTYVFKK